MITKVIMPKLGETMEEGIITKWIKSEGEKISKGEPLFEISTDKATFEVEAPADGYLRKILIPASDKPVKVTQVVGYIGTDLSEQIPEESTKEEAIQEEIPMPHIEKRVVEKIKISPLAKRLAQEKGIDITQIKGTGPGGRIEKKDIEDFIAKKTPAAVISELTGIRKIIAERLSYSKKEIPHFYLHTEVNMSEVVKRHQELQQKQQIKITYTDIILKATGMALQGYIKLNSLFEGSKIKNFIDINIGLAVNIEDGLVVPVIKTANKKSIVDIARERSNLVEKARANKLTIEDISEGSFTITNLGMFGIDFFDAIINPPQVAILAIGAIKEQPVASAGKINIAPVAKLSLSCDHRVVDGVYAAQFLTHLKELLEKPDIIFS